MRKWIGVILAASAAASLSAPAEAKVFDALYSFGDSLTDVGNVFIYTKGLEPASPYVDGRFSNGPNWIDQLSAKLKLGAQVPYLDGGSNFAFGGAVTGSAVPLATTQVPNIGQQVNLFSAAHGGVASPDALYTVWIGANDVFQALDDIVTKTITLDQAKADLAQAAAAEAAAVDQLASEGAKYFLIPLVPDLGLTPDSRSFGVSAYSTALSFLYNQSLRADLRPIAISQHVYINVFDTFAQIDAAVANPAAFGFTDVTTPCYSGSLTGGGSVCANPGQHLFWDGQHPTTAADAIVAQAAFEQLTAAPEPSTWAMLLLGFSGLVLLRRHAWGVNAAPESGEKFTSNERNLC